jgi:selenocysteine lyase/cysteine desulfurase
MSLPNLEIQIRTNHDDDSGSIHIDHYDENTIWFSCYKHRASLAFVLSVEEAKQIMDGLQRAIAAKEAACS